MTYIRTISDKIIFWGKIRRWIMALQVKIFFDELSAKSDIYMSGQMSHFPELEVAFILALKMLITPDFIRSTTSSSTSILFSSTWIILKMPQTFLFEKVVYSNSIFFFPATQTTCIFDRSDPQASNNLFFLLLLLIQLFHTIIYTKRAKRWQVLLFSKHIL